VSDSYGIGNGSERLTPVSSLSVMDRSPGGSPFAYVPDASRDEVFGPDGLPRAHCRDWLRDIEMLGVEDMQRRWDHARRLIRDNGVTYNVYGDPRGMDRPWELDPIPLVVDAPEWTDIARGLEQRATLLNCILLDIYGEQKLLTRGLLPPELVLALPGFLRPMHGVKLPRGIALHMAASDLARAPGGGFWVLSDRTQTPSGAGYALENRIVISRTLPGVFHDARVQRLASYFRTLRDTLLSLAPRGRESPRIVLLTPGPHNETYFEHAYLARYLGFALVEGADLTVRDRQVYVKTLGGLERVDVILRRLDDAFCDPLSLRSDSSLGVAGLVHAVRAGKVAVANALGSGLVETPALLAFLPKLCRELLGEDLLLPSVPTYWCGDPEARSYVLDHLDAMVIKTTAWGPEAFEPMFVGGLSSSERSDLRARIKTRPEAFVAQESVPLSTAPVWTKGRLQPRHITIRAYVTHSPRGYETMPGGLTRVSATQDSLVVTMQRGGGSKDLWIRAENNEVNPVTLLRQPSQHAEVLRSGGDLPSRVADNMFWLGRYLERAENAVRLLRALFARLTDETTTDVPELTQLLHALEVTSDLETGSITGPEVANMDPVQLVVAERPQSSLRATVIAAHRSASVVRDRLSSDTWRIIGQVQRMVIEASGTPNFRLSDAFDLLGQLLVHFSALSGLAHENMTHGPGWRFADMGRRVERLHHTARLLRTLLVPVDADDAPTLEALLEIADSAITYRTRYLGMLQVPLVLDLLLTDESNPRSIGFQLAALGAHIERLPRADRSPRLPEEARITLSAIAKTRLADVNVLAAADAGNGRPALDALLAELEHEAPHLAESLTRGYLSHAAPSQSLDGRS
jgi:uncharacterized circularly permuted ATP-grasp superfamily protein/uncharacterized alpha-E superfamily protein